MSRFVALHVSYLLQPPSLLVSLCFFIFFVKWKWPFLSSTATSNYLKKAVLLLFFLCPSFLGQKQLLLCWYSYCIANFNQCGMISFPPPNSIFFWTCSPKLVTDVLCNIQSWSSAAATVGLKEQRFGLTHKRTDCRWVAPVQVESTVSGYILTSQDVLPKGFYLFCCFWAS